MPNESTPLPARGAPVLGPRPAKPASTETIPAIETRLVQLLRPFRDEPTSYQSFYSDEAKDRQCQILIRNIMAIIRHNLVTFGGTIKVEDINVVSHNLSGLKQSGEASRLGIVVFAERSEGYCGHYTRLVLEATVKLGEYAIDCLAENVENVLRHILDW